MTPRGGGRRAGIVLAFCLFGVAIFAVLFHAGGGRVPGQTGYRVQAVVPDAVALTPSAEVRMAGVTVGRVDGIATRAGNAVLMLELDDEHAPVYRDARVRVRMKSLVGENYVELESGSPRAGTVADGGVLPLRSADEATQLDQVLSTLSPRTRRDLRHTVAALGSGLADRGDDLNRLFGATASAVAATRPVAALLAAQRRQVAGLVDDVGRVSQALGDRRDAIRLFVPRLTTTAEAIAARDRQLAQTIDELPPTLDQVETTTAHLARFSPRATPVVDRLADALERLEPAVARLRPAAAATRTTVARLDGFARRGTPLLDDLRRFGGTAAAIVPSLDRALAELVPTVDYLAPYSREAGAFFANLRSAVNSRDATGKVARVHGIVTTGTLVPVSDAQKRLLDTLFSVGALSKLRTHGINAYPKPSEIGRAKPFSGRYPRVQALPPAR